MTSQIRINQLTKTSSLFCQQVTFCLYKYVDIYFFGGLTCEGRKGPSINDVTQIFGFFGPKGKFKLNVKDKKLPSFSDVIG